MTMRLLAEHRRARAAFSRALTRFREIPKLGRLSVIPLTVAEQTELLELANSTAVEALLWARAFSDAASGDEPDIDPVPGYPADIPGLPAYMRAARYAANKGVHQLIELAKVQNVPMTGPRGMAPHAGIVQAPMLRWVSDETALPQQTKRDEPVRPSFVMCWLGELVEPTLTEVEDYLAQW